MQLSDSVFKRLFSMTLYKNLKISMGSMTFTKDFVTDKRGDMYPILEKSRDLVEVIEKNTYYIKAGRVKRFMTRFFPYATYELTFNSVCGKAGFVFKLPQVEASVLYSCGRLIFSDNSKTEEYSVNSLCGTEITMIVSCRPGAFDVYFRINNKPELITTFKSDSFSDSNHYDNFTNASAYVYAEGNVTVKEALSYIDNGISTADIRTIRYENGDVMVENGKIYLSVTLRLEEEMIQGILSWIPGTCEFDLTGVLFYDYGDGKWCGDVAASILYNRNVNMWYMWVCSFSHEHVLAHSEFEGDPRFGVNVIDAVLMKKSESSDITRFEGFSGDEDPDFFYDEREQKWFMAICRTNPETKDYSYLFFESESPFDNYTYIGKGKNGAETGGSFVKIDGKQYFICGNDYNKVSDYRAYSKDGMENLKFNFPDGGFRGWGTIIPVKQTSRTRYYHLTFDRHNASDYNWSYGNLYCFEL